MFISKKELKSKKPDIKTDNSRIYFLSDRLLAKCFRGMSSIARKECLLRFEYLDNITDLKNVSLPVDIVETENGFCGYVEEILPGTLSGNLGSYTEHCNKKCYDITLDDITSYILEVCNIVDACHKNGMVNPDLSSDGNVLFNPHDRTTFLTDYQGMQVGDIKTKHISSFIAADPIIHTEKYYSNGMFTPNIDLYTLAIRFFYYATKINVPRAINGYTINELLKMAGIADTSFGDCMRTLYKPSGDNLDIREPIQELNANYQLTRFKTGQVRNLVKKDSK